MAFLRTKVHKTENFQPQKKHSLQMENKLLIHMGCALPKNSSPSSRVEDKQVFPCIKFVGVESLG